MTDYSDATRLSDLTVGQFRHLFHSCAHGNEGTDTEVKRRPTGRLVYGLRGIQNLLGCSHKSAQYYKDYIIKDAVVQNGRKIIVDADYALELFATNKGEKK
mgnify:CR=1 FL=1